MTNQHRRIVRLRQRGLTLQEVGDLLGVSKQRVHAVCKLYDVGKPVYPVKWHCQQCGSANNRMPAWKAAKRKFCSKECADEASRVWSREAVLTELLRIRAGLGRFPRSTELAGVSDLRVGTVRRKFKTWKHAVQIAKQILEGEPA